MWKHVKFDSESGNGLYLEDNLPFQNSLETEALNVPRSSSTIGLPLLYQSKQTSMKYLRQNTFLWLLLLFPFMI